MNSIFDPLIPKNEENFSGYCFQVKDDDGNSKIYFVKAESAEKDKYYYYLVGVLGANVYGDKINDGDFNSNLDEETLEALEEFAKEVAMLDKFRSEYLIHFYGAVFIPYKICMVTEFAEYGSIEDLKKKMPDKHAISQKLKTKMLKMKWMQI